MSTDTRAQVQITYKKRRGKKKKVLFFQAQALVFPRVFIVSCTSGTAFPCVSKKISDKNQKTMWKAWRSH